MHIPRLLILPLLISVCVAAQPVPGNTRLPGNMRLPGYRFLCIESEPKPPAWIKNLFPRPVLSQQLPTTDGTILKHIIPPSEFLVHNLTLADPSGLCLLAPRPLCDGICVHVDEKGRIHPAYMRWHLCPC